jgi:hypothetical protein
MTGADVLMVLAGGLRGRGHIAGRDVCCITPELQLAFHSAYELTERERRDVALLAEPFGLEPFPPTPEVHSVGPLV